MIIEKKSNHVICLLAMKCGMKILFFYSVDRLFLKSERFWIEGRYLMENPS